MLKLIEHCHTAFSMWVDGGHIGQPGRLNHSRLIPEKAFELEHVEHCWHSMGLTMSELRTKWSPPCLDIYHYKLTHCRNAGLQALTRFVNSIYIYIGNRD
eukprot:scaffold81975_cov24-Prasinocladus_malaysianus.AAC.1